MPTILMAFIATRLTTSSCHSFYFQRSIALIDSFKRFITNNFFLIISVYILTRSPYPGRGVHGGDVGYKTHIGGRIKISRYSLRSNLFIYLFFVVAGIDSSLSRSLIVSKSIAIT